MSLSTHVLDATSGLPAPHVTVTLLSWEGAPLHSDTTNSDGRIPHLAPQLAAGKYRIHFDTGSYFAERGIETFYPEIVVAFTVSDPERHYHVPILLSPFAFSTYRGS